MAQPGITVAGNPAPIRVAVARELSITDAPETRSTYRGTNLALGLAFNNLARNAARASFRQDGAAASAEIVLKDLKVVTDTVEMDFNSVHREWWTAPAYAVLSTAARVRIITAIDRFNVVAAEVETAAAAAALFQNEKTVLNNNNAGEGDAFEDVYMNGETYIALLPVITFTRTVSRSYAFPFVILDIGKVFHTTSLELPTHAQLVIQEVVNTIAANSLQTLGWLKTGRYGVTSDGSAQYVQQYIFDAYPTRRYTFI